VLKRLPPSGDPRLLVGYDTSDDAGVYQIAEDAALVQTVDFFTPVVDDPISFGEIAAANSLSDVYAMGGKPLTALTLVCFPAQGPAELLEKILRGGLEKMREARCTVVGGHSVRDDELKFGYAVTGWIHPRRVWRNQGAQAGDALILTKPIGTGVIATALKQGKAKEEWASAAAVSMRRLNRDAAEALAETAGESDAAKGPVHAVTDVTGFGLLGHAREMALASGVSLRVESASVEYLAGAAEAARGGFLAAGLKNNREFLEGCIEFGGKVAEEIRNLLLDPQTSGGLLAAVAPDAAERTMHALERRGVSARRIGEATARRSPLIEVS
jgi:selenide, water dikinase